MIVYKIRRKSDGKFSTGSSRPSFSDTGKVWTSKRGLNSHMSMFLKKGEHITFHNLNNPKSKPIERHRYYVNTESSYWNNANIYSDCEVVEFEITETENSVVGAIEYLNEYAKQRSGF